MSASPLEPVFIAGATAVGKSEVAFRVAQRLNGEIISVDSMQVYRGLDLGTAKPSVAERARVPHHLIDVTELNEPFDAARFRELAQGAVREMQRRGRVPVFCGGTGLYFQAYLCGLGHAPPANRALRARLEATPMQALLDELERGDAAGFATMDRQNPRRVIRAVEVLRLTGRPPSELRAAWPPSPVVTARFFVLHREPGDLRRRIETRVDRMFARGLVQETRTLLDRGLRDNPTAMQALGYRQVVEHLEGERSLEATLALVKIRTWQFARRQRTWFTRQLRARWLHVAQDEPTETTASRLESMIAQPWPEVEATVGAMPPDAGPDA